MVFSSLNYFSRVDVLSNGCWQWIGGKSASDYAVFGNKRTSIYIYELMAGEYSEHLVRDHLCKNTLCVNPFHIEQVSQGVNLLRGLHGNGSRTHCIHGHEFNEENTYRYRNMRVCRTCRKLWGKRNKYVPLVNHKTNNN